MVDCNWQRPLWHTQKLQPVWREDKRCLSIFAWSQVWQNVVNYRTVPVKFLLVAASWPKPAALTGWFQRPYRTATEQCAIHVWTPYKICNHFFTALWLCAAKFMEIDSCLKIPFWDLLTGRETKMNEFIQCRQQYGNYCEFYVYWFNKKNHSPPAAVYIKPVWQTGFILNLVDNLIWAHCMFMLLLY